MRGGSAVPGIHDGYGRRRLLPILAAAALLFLPAADASAGEGRPSFDLSPGAELSPAFNWRISDYAARCPASGTTVEIAAARGWRSQADDGRPVAGDSSAELATGGERTKIVFSRVGTRSRSRSFNVRCLPGDFPEYEAESLRRLDPLLFMIQMNANYVAIFNEDGVPIWWFQAPDVADDAKVLPDGTISWIPVDRSFDVGPAEIRSLAGKLLGTAGDGLEVDVHDLQLLPGGNYVIGAATRRSGIDASGYGGSADAVVRDMEITELTPGGRTAWAWNSGEFIGLDETTNWDFILGFDAGELDVSHWNSVDIRGRYVYLSFRNLDAVYKVDRRTGRIVWKLGGTETNRSLEVRGLPVGREPLIGQHDARMKADGTLTVFDNRWDPTGTGRPAALRWRIDEDRGTATLVERVRDPAVDLAFCCGSARLLRSGDWLVGWGSAGIVGAYDRRGRPSLRLSTPGAFTYRANEVPARWDDPSRIRRAMDRIVRSERAD